MRALVLGSLVLLAACQTVQPGYWHRQSDGRRVDANDAIYTAFLADKAICDGEAAKAALVSTERSRFTHSYNVNLVYDGCLTARGYVRR